MQYIIPFIFPYLSESDLEYFVFSTINIYSHLFVVILDPFVSFFDKQRTFLPKGSDKIHIFSKIYTTKYYVEHEIYANQNFSATDMWAVLQKFSGPAKINWHRKTNTHTWMVSFFSPFQLKRQWRYYQQ